MKTAPPDNARRVSFPKVVFALTVCGGISLLTLAVWPGVLETTAFGFPGIVISAPLLGVWLPIVCGLAIRDVVHAAHTTGTRPRWGIHSMGIMLVTLALLWFHVPQCIALAFCLTQFQTLVVTVNGDRFQAQSLDQWVGPYYVDQGGADRGGGTYLRTHSWPDGISPDRMSFGFVFQPTRRETPFGSARLRHRRLFGSWYVFAVSDD